MRRLSVLLLLLLTPLVGCATREQTAAAVGATAALGATAVGVPPAGALALGGAAALGTLAILPEPSPPPECQRQTDIDTDAEIAGNAIGEEAGDKHVHISCLEAFDANSPQMAAPQPLVNGIHRKTPDSVPNATDGGRAFRERMVAERAGAEGGGGTAQEAYDAEYERIMRQRRRK